MSKRAYIYIMFSTAMDGAGPHADTRQVHEQEHGLRQRRALTERMLSIHFRVAFRAPYSRRSLSPSPAGSSAAPANTGSTSFSGRLSTASCAAPLCTFDRASSSLLCRARSTITCIAGSVFRILALIEGLTSDVRLEDKVAPILIEVPSPIKRSTLPESVTYWWCCIDHALL